MRTLAAFSLIVLLSAGVTTMGALPTLPTGAPGTPAAAPAGGGPGDDDLPLCC
ncbi:hypothetical protein ACGFNV_40405 [Streptomyces sp. NPDC048751]|uniref:hypothetical protein n=1 Tax=Streptomyces sp. NPDC048751 TaxID=3365591 RepID=UPI003719D967